MVCIVFIGFFTIERSVEYVVVETLVITGKVVVDIQDWERIGLPRLIFVQPTGYNDDVLVCVPFMQEDQSVYIKLEQITLNLLLPLPREIITDPVPAVEIFPTLSFAHA